MRTLTPSQQSAVLYSEGDESVLAGAGSGKTFVIVEKTAALIERWHVTPERILVVTFTDKAAEEVGGRISKRLGRGMQVPIVSTIHGFAADVLRQEGTSLDVAPDFRILNDYLANLERARVVREKLIERIGQEDSETLEVVSRFGFHRTLGFFMDVLSEPSRRRNGAPFPETLKALEERYHSRKKALNALDFDDLETMLLELTHHQPGRFESRFSWIIVDEFQDTSPIQWEIVSRLKTLSPARLVIVGDPRQSIYRFRGADPSLFLKVAGDIKKDRGGRAFDLSENFRSAPEIITFINAVSEGLFPGDFPPLRPRRIETPGVVDRLLLADEARLADFRAAEARAVAERLVDLRAHGDLWKSMAILFKTRKAVPDYERAFREANVPYRTSLGEPLLERPEVLSLLFWMARKTAKETRAFLETAIAQSPLRDFVEDLAVDPLPEYLDRLFEASLPCFAEGVHRNLKAFHDLLKDLMSLGIAHLKGLVEAVRDLREDEARITCPNDMETSEDAVTIMTVHGSKGLEWPIVVLGDLKAAQNRPPSLYVASEDGEFLLKDGDANATGLKTNLVKNEAFQEREAREREEALEESKRLLYVALTRARDRLVLPLPLPPKGKGKERRQARWCDWLQP